MPTPEQTTTSRAHAPSGTTGPSSGSAVRLEGVTKSFGATTVLHGVDLDLSPGELVCLLGPSGCGKTTALRCIAGLEPVSAGRVLIGGSDVTEVPVNRRDIGMVFQQYSLFPHMTVARNVEFGLGMRRVARAERATRVGEMLEIVGLSHLAERFPHELSGGQQQRVALARALVTRPRALLLDEPLSALDAKVRVRLRDQIRAIQTELGITTVFVTHDQEEALAVSDRVAVMEGGRIAQLGTPEDLYRRPVSPFVADFVGLSNRVAGVLDGASVRVRGAQLPVIQPADGASPGRTGDPVTAFIRPEHVRLSASAAGGDSSAVVLTTGFLGPIRRTIVQFADGAELAVQHGSETAYEAGDRVDVAFASEPVTVAPRA
ncbi:ABC transporter ATP-binding protein [Leucobacter sp. CSA2]|uniref:ABC-type quaternary amine transporter n=1 Tax=Leucobacter edaphi TaxID=2796472 RepID=A0A934UXW6_9MICO|nr:ABC transporter ATP-binding protein [Leucobacter edaphi]MBK0421773.1 ABC transporter ATP-binding protein [Leucobacter edaphi]